MNKLPKIFLVVSLPLYVLDQITKWWVVMKFHEPFVLVDGEKRFIGEDRYPVIEGFFNLVRRHNQGVAFGFGNGTSWAPILFLFVLVAALVMITVFWKKGAFANRPSKWAAALLVAGILGNLTDRLLQGFFLKAYEGAGFFERLAQGYVVDFLDFKLPFYERIAPASGGHWPAFNVADSCITCAAVLLVISAFFFEENVNKSGSDESE